MLRRRTLLGLALALAIVGGSLVVSSEAEAAKIIVINTGARTWPVGPVPATLQTNPLFRDYARQGAQLAYRCSAFGVFWAYLHWWDCRPVLTLGNRDFVMPAAVAANVAKLYPQSTMKMNFWAQHGRWILIVLVIASLIWGAIERNRTIVVVRTPG
jgi:hypothetical protein